MQSPASNPWDDLGGLTVEGKRTQTRSVQTTILPILRYHACESCLRHERRHGRLMSVAFLCSGWVTTSCFILPFTTPFKTSNSQASKQASKQTCKPQPQMTVMGAVGCHDTALDQSGMLLRRGKQYHQYDLVYS